MSNYNSSLSNLLDVTNDGDDSNSEINRVGNPKSSVIGNHTWWDRSFHSRQIINITNPYPESFENYGVSISFNYSTYVNAGYMNQSLKDIRIIEYDSDGDPHLKKYYFQKDYPDNDIVTVWFDTDVLGSSTEFDTYLYYGNDAVEINTTYFMNKTSAFVADNLGWIRNGNFEQDIKTGLQINDTFGWYYEDDVPNDVNGPYEPNLPSPTNYQHNLTSDTINQESVIEGNYSFKWGDIAHDVSSGGIGNDLSGTLYSTPFVVPIVSGGSNKIYINAWRNFRTYDEQKNKQFGLFVRIATNFGTDVETHTAYPGTVYTNGYVEAWDTFWDDPRVTWVRDPNGILPDKSTSAGQLTGDLLIDVSDYQGEAIFLEFGMFDYHNGEFGKFYAFAQVDNVTFSYDLQATLDPDIEQRKAEVTVNTRDVDGRIVPNAEVLLINSTQEYTVLETQYTSFDDGSAIFPSVDFGDYNFTVNYTLPEGKEIVVYNSSAIGGFPGYTIDSAQASLNFELDIWTIDFEMVDYDEEPLNYGYILVNETPGVYLANLTLDGNGKATFRGKNQSEYYYQLFYDNNDYSLNPTALNESYIYRSTYEQNNKYLAQTLYIKQLNLNATNDPVFTVNQRVYTDGSLSELGNKKITYANINISLLDQGCDFTSVRLYYIDKDNSTEGNLIYENTSYVAADIEEIIDFDVRFPPIASANLPGDSYNIYGLLIELVGDNSSATVCDGVIKVNFTETTNIYNTTDLVKLNVKIVDTYDVGVSACYVNVNSSQGRAAGFNVDLKTDDTGYAFGQGNTDLPFWYLRGYQYNFTLTFLGDHVDLNVTESDQWPGFTGYYYNYSLLSKNNITLKLHFGVGVVINLSKYQTMFKDLDVVDVTMWGENVTVNVNFTKTDDDWITSNPIMVPTTLNCTVRSTGIGAKTYFTLVMASGAGAGIYTVTFNSSLLSAGTRGGEVYSVIISGNKDGYIDPTDISDTIYVTAVPTILSMHDYDNVLVEIDKISQIFGNSINLTVRYYNQSNSPLTDAILTYEWLQLDPIQFYEDPINPGYYTTALNTSIAGLWGLKSIKITAIRENYTTQTFLTSLSISERPTTLNDETDLVYMSPWIWVQDVHNFTFEYEDALTSDIVGELSIFSYSWYELDENGDRINGSQGTGNLVENLNKTYFVDFDTELKHVGFYFLHITLQKENYEPRFAYIDLEIKLREFTAIWDATGKGTSNRVQVVQGTDIDFQVDLEDISRSQDLENATVTLNLGGTNYDFDELSPAIYTREFRTNTIAAFFTPQTLTGSITIEKANFTTQIIPITVIVSMEEIFPGMPSFYFILITASVIGVVGSIVGYRVIQQARIPKHVKKIRKIKGAIKSKKKIADTISIPSKAEMLAKLFGDDWKELGLSINEALGIKDVKSKKVSELPLDDKLTKEGGKVE
jgi:hypothetical protein